MRGDVPYLQSELLDQVNPFAHLRCCSSSLKPAQSAGSPWLWSRSRNCFSPSGMGQIAAVGCWLGFLRLLVSDAGLGGSALLLPPKPAVMVWPVVCPTAEPTATPAAVVAIWAVRPGCRGAADGGAAASGWAAGAGVGTAPIWGVRLARGAMWELRLWLPCSWLVVEQLSVYESEFWPRAFFSYCMMKCVNTGKIFMTQWSSVLQMPSDDLENHAWVRKSIESGKLIKGL